MVEGSTTQETLPEVQNNNTQKNNFESIQEIFQISEVGIMRLSKLVPDHTDNHEIFDEDFQRKIDFYQKFLGLKIQVNIIENEIFAGYKKVSVDIDGKINAQMWKYIFTQMIPYLESSGFQKSFLSLETLKDIPNEVFEQYMQFVNADFLQEKQNVVKDIILWLELAICTRLSQERGYGDKSEFFQGHENFQDALVNISHVAKMESEFQEKLEEMYLSLLRYKNPKMQSLLKMLGYNVSKNIASKKLIARTRSQFSISVAKILGSLRKKEEKPKKKIPLLSFKSAKKLLGNSENKKTQGYQKGDELTENEWKELNRLFGIDGIRLLNYGDGHFVDSSYYDALNNIYLQAKHKDQTGLSYIEEEHKRIFLKIGLDIKNIQLFFEPYIGLRMGYASSSLPPHPKTFGTPLESLDSYWNYIQKKLSSQVTFVKGLTTALETDVVINGRKNANYKFNIDILKKNENGFVNLPKKYVGLGTMYLAIFNGISILNFILLDKNKIRVKEVRPDCNMLFFDYMHNGDYSGEILLENGDKYLINFYYDCNIYKHLGNIMIKKLEQKENSPQLSGEIDEVSTGVSKKVLELISSFNGIATLEEVFLSRKSLDIKSVFGENIRKFVSGKVFFDQEGFLHIDGKIEVQELLQKSDFGICVKGLLSGDFEEENILLQKEKLTFAEFLDFVKETQARLQSYQEKDTKNGIEKLLQENLEIFKTDEKKRKLLSEIIVAKKQEFHPDLLDFYRELGKIDKDFRKFYTLSSLPKIEKVQVLKTLLSRNHLDIGDVWGYLSDELKNKFFASFGELFDYEIPKKRFYEVLSGVKKELEYLLGDDIGDILVVFDDLFGDDNYLVLEEEIRDISEENIIKKDLKIFFMLCAEKRKQQIEAEKEKIEKRKQEIIEFIQKLSKEKNQIAGLVFDYDFDEKGYLTGHISFKIERYSYGGKSLPKLKLILEGGLSEKKYFHKVDLNGLQEVIGNGKIFHLLKESSLSEEDFISYFDSKTDKELQLYIGEVQKFIYGNDKRFIFTNKQFARRFLERCYSLDEKFLTELVIFEISEAKTFEDLVKIKRTIGTFDKAKWTSFVPRELNKIVEDDLLDALRQLDFVRVGYYLQLDDEGVNFLQELQKQDFNNASETLSFTQKNRGKGIIISQICILIDNYIVIQTKKTKTVRLKFDDDKRNTKIISEYFSLIYSDIIEEKNNIKFLNKKNNIKFLNKKNYGVNKK